MIKKLLFLLSFMVFGNLLAQNFDKKVLFSINKEPVYASEFLKVYQKNLELIPNDSRQNVDEYLEMFINYKVKVQQAKEMKLDTNAAFKTEFNRYRNQLAENFLTDTKVTNELVKEAYERTLEEVNAAHILFMVDPNANPNDTIAAYNKALEVRKKILQGADFSELAKKYSEDPSAKRNAGELGWFNAFKMVYPFEDAAYKTQVGEISKPVRTRFGYHLIKVNDRRESGEKIQVAHIMIAHDEKKPAFAEEKIQNVLQKLQAGTSFEELAEKYSDDEATAKRGGKLEPFNKGKLNSPAFEDAAFELQKIGEISQAFKTKHGWHVVKLVKKEPIPSFEEMKAQLEEKIKRDSRSRIITEAFIKDLKKHYQIKKDKKAFQFFKKYVQKQSAKEASDYLANKGEREFIRIKDSVATYEDFMNFINKRYARAGENVDKVALLKNWHDDFINYFILDYHKEHLEEENKEFAALAKEYKEGLLLFDLMEEKIWGKAKTDSLELKNFYFKNKEDYPAGKNFEEVRGAVISDYQKHLEEKWVSRLRSAAEIEVNKKVLKKVKKHLEQD